MAELQDFYANQVVLLTGSTGHLGGCILYKLLLVLRVPQVYVLVRSTPDEAVSKWQRLLPEHWSIMLQSKAVTFLHGDVTVPGLGLPEDLQRRLVDRVTLVINAAADISLKASLRESVIKNCQSALSLACMASRFSRLVGFVQISSLFALSHLPDGPVEERPYPIQDAETVYRAILDGVDKSWDGYAWPYARSKHLMECLLEQRHPELPLLIVRPSSIGPAIAQPFELYGLPPSIPISNLMERLMSQRGGVSIFRPTQGSRSGTNVLDEIPVDLAANILLQHVHRGSRGIVHACSLSYVPRTFDQVVQDVFRYVSPRWRAEMTKVMFSVELPESQLARFYRVGTRGWAFCNTRSIDLDKSGPLGIDTTEHDVDGFTKRRVESIFQKVTSSKPRSKLGAKL